MANDTDKKSSFLKRTLSKEDAIIQFYRPRLGNKMTTALDLFETVLNEVETAVTLGVMIQCGGPRHHATPDDLRANMDEFAELEIFAKEGRALLNKMGYVSLRQNTPMVGDAPVGKTVDVKPITMQLPGEEPLQGALLSPKPGEDQPKPVTRHPSRL